MDDQDQLVRNTIDLIPGYIARYRMDVFDLVGCQSVFDAKHTSQCLKIVGTPFQITIKRVKRTVD